MWIGRSTGGYALERVRNPSGSLRGRFAGTGDIDGSGTADILWHGDVPGSHAPSAEGRLEWWYMQGSQAADYPRSLTLPIKYIPKAVADLDGDGRADVVWADTDGTELWQWRSLGDGFAAEWIRHYPPAGWEMVGAGDIDTDGAADLIWHNRGLQQVDWWLMAGATIRAYGARYVPERYGIQAIGDFDANGQADLVWTDRDRTELWLWQAQPSVASEPRWIGQHPAAPWALARGQGVFSP